MCGPLEKLILSVIFAQIDCELLIIRYLIQVFCDSQADLMCTCSRGRQAEVSEVQKGSLKVFECGRSQGSSLSTALNLQFKGEKIDSKGLRKKNLAAWFETFCRYSEIRMTEGVGTSRSAQWLKQKVCAPHSQRSLQDTRSKIWPRLVAPSRFLVCLKTFLDWNLTVKWCFVDLSLGRLSTTHF